MYYLLPLAALLAFTAAQGVGTPSHRIILDAGNTSTVLKIYEINVVHTKSGSDYNVKLVLKESFSPGVRTLLTDPNFLLHHLDSVLAKARVYIPSAHYEWSYVHVYLNSGLRFLPATDIQLILNSIGDLLYQNRVLNPFQFEKSNVQLLAGEDEAVSSWLAANYLLGSLDGRRFQNETIGVLDMGNEATAITFVPDEPQYAEKYPLIFDRKRHELYTQNYLQYGSESIYVKIQNVLENRSLGGPEPWNPCMLKDDWKQVQLSDGRIVTHWGSGDPLLCEEILTQIVKPNTGDECWPKPCALGRVYQPNVHDTPFIATFGFAYTLVALGTMDESKIIYLDRLREAGIDYCRKSVSQVMAEYQKDRESASQDCLMSILTPTLFVKAFGFPLDTRQIRLVPDVEGELIDWPLGMVLQLIDRYD